MAHADRTTWKSALSSWLREDRIALLIIVFAAMIQLLIVFRLLAPGEVSGNDMSIHLAEVKALADSLAEGDLHLWNPSANGGFASGYYYQFIPQLGCALLYLVSGWLVAISTVFKLTIAAALVALPLTIYRGLRIIGLGELAAAAGALGASTLYATSGWGAGIDSLFSNGLYTQAFALVFYPLALAYAARFMLEGECFGRAVIYTLLTGFCHPFIAVAITPPLLFLPWWRIGLWDSLRRGSLLFAGALLGAAPLWLPIVVHYDAFGGFPERVAGEDGIAFSSFVAEFGRGAFFDVSRRAVTTVVIVAALPLVLLRRARPIIPLYLAGFAFAAMIVLGPVIGKTDGDLLPAVRFLAPMQLFLAAAGWAALAVGIRELVRWATPRLRRNRILAIGGSVFLGIALIALVTELGSGVTNRAESQVRTVEAYDTVNNDELARIIEALKAQPPGRMFAASEFGSGTHWWMYLPFVYSGNPAVRAYGGAALQSSPNYVYLRTADLFRVHGFFATRYLIARDDLVSDSDLSERFADLVGQTDVIHTGGGYTLYAFRDVRMFRTVTEVGVVRGNRKGRTAKIHAWLRSPDSDPDYVITEEPLGATAKPDSVTVLETRHSRRSHAARLVVNGDKPALIQLAVSFHPGWKAQIDGREAEVHRVSPAFVAAMIPPGEHEIRFTFERPPWTWLLYALLFAAIAGYRFRLRRRDLRTEQ